MAHDKWQPNFLRFAPAFEIFAWLSEEFVAKSSWPQLADYNRLAALRCRICNYLGMPINFIARTTKNYELTIYEQGEVATRENNWHDFFNMLIWYTFPKIKASINDLHYQHCNNRELSLRTSFENLLTVLDESGLIIACSNDELLDNIRTMNWKELFWYQRQKLENLSCFVLGHSVHEKLLQPYVGLVGHAVLLKVDQGFFTESLETKTRFVDESVQNWLKALLPDASPRILHPVPILGFPNWYAGNELESFYDNKNYFRESRKKF